MKDIKLSVIIPLAPGECLNEQLELQLLNFPTFWEILICSPQRVALNSKLASRATWIQAENGRANCLNAGALHATGDYLWFLHADSILLDNTAEKLAEAMERNEDVLYYFDLKFYTKGCYLVWLNEIGVLFRSRCLYTPFGDQAFLIKTELFRKLPAFSTEVKYGEDHMLVMDYRRNQVPIRPIGLKILTNARKYEENGWLRTTAAHLHLWRKQARQQSIIEDNP